MMLLSGKNFLKALATKEAFILLNYLWARAESLPGEHGQTSNFR